MSEPIHPDVQSRSSLPLVATLVLLGLLLLGIATAAAIRHNPLYSDREPYGISKYKLIENCKEQLHDAANLDLHLQGQPIKLGTLIDQSKQLKLGEHVIVKPSGDSAALVSSVQEVEGKQLNLNTPVVLGLSTPVIIGAEIGDSQRALGQANMLCYYDKATGKTDVALSIGQ